MNDGSRTANVKRNILWSTISHIVLALFSMISRTVFIYVLGVKYLGVSGLFSNILGILSFTNLGIGSAINYALYKPIAENDTEKIKSLMKLYKTAYRIIAGVIAVLGCLVVPFLTYLVNTDIPMSQIRIFYMLFLIDTIASYFVSYKTSYVTAIQKNYVITNLNTIASVLTYVVQMGILLIIPNYLIYLINQIIMSFLLKITMVIYLNKKYPILSEKDALPLDMDTKKSIRKNVKALVIHRFGDAAVNQTDNIIISMFVGTISVGIMSNYIALNTIVGNFTNTLLNSFTASFGNLIAKETVEKQRKIFDLYDFAGFWVYGFVFIAFTTLIQPFITLWLGKDLLVDDLTMVLFFASIYLQGLTIITYNFKTAAGRFDEDKWIAFVQAVVNLVVSIICVNEIGLPGVYVGTIAQRLIVVVVRPYIVYKYVLMESSIKYYLRFLGRLGLVLGILVVMWKIKTVILSELSIVRFITMVGLTAIVPNTIILLIYGRTEMFKTLFAKYILRKKI